MVNVDIDECASNPCLNGATCIDKVNEYRCVCADGWTGKRCQHSKIVFDRFNY